MQLQDLANVVTVLGFILALVAFAVDQWDKKRQRFVFAVGVLMVLLGLGLARGFRSAAPGPEASGKAAPAPGTTGVRDTPVAVSDSPPAIGDTPPVEPRHAPEPIPPYHSWLRRQNLLIRYNAAVYMAGSCPGRIMAVGDFSTGGWTSGPEAHCEPDGWISFDAGQLLDEPRFIVGRTYCLNFVDERRRYGLHGSPPRAPGLSAIEVPAKEGPEVGLNIGFRIVTLHDGTHAVEFTNAGAAHCE